MGLFSKLFGGDQNATVLDVEANSAELDAEEAAARRTLDVINTRHDALLMSGDDTQLDADAVAKSKATRTLERVALARQELAFRLVDARKRARVALIAELLRERNGHVTKLRVALHTAVDANEAAQTFYEKCRALLGHEAEAMFPTTAYPLLRRGMIEPWEAYINQRDGAKSQEETLRTRPRAAISAPVQRPENPSSGPVTRPPRGKRSPRASLPEAIAPGHIRCIVLRDGYEGPAAEMLVTGDLIDLPDAIADEARRNGAVEHYASPSPGLPEL